MGPRRDVDLVLRRRPNAAGARKLRDCRWQGNQREREARGRGDEFRRFTYQDVFEDPRYLLAELDRFLPRES